MEKVIVGDISWLRNDYVINMTIGGVTYPTLEHAYQASKFNDKALKFLISKTDDVSEARRIGKSNKIRSDFDRLSVMNSLLHKKFFDNANFGKELANLSGPIVMEGHDDFWGTGNDGFGDNEMGQLLESIRDELRIIHDVDPSAACQDCASCCGCDKDSIPSLKDAIINNPDEDLAQACQDLLDSAKSVANFIDKDDYNADYISNKTGQPLHIIEDAIEKVKSFQSKIDHIGVLLASDAPGCGDGDEDDDDDDQEEDYEDEQYDDDENID